MESSDVFKKLDKMQDKISELCVLSARMEVDLRHHVEGNIQNRKQIELIKKDIFVWKGILIAATAVVSFVSPIVILAIRAWII